MRAPARVGAAPGGPRLEHDPVRGADIVSDAVTPGAIQVPGDGRPIVLLADCQTVGGYPKIATVIGADLPRLGHAQPGQTLRFVEVDMAQALAARSDAAAARVPPRRGWGALPERGIPRRPRSRPQGPAPRRPAPGT